jgi:CRISPR-associated exonuclease Cas4
VNQRFAEHIRKGLAQADSGLGDRSKYVGASDVGGCLRKAYLGKYHRSEYDLAQHIVFRRGHIGEGIIDLPFQVNGDSYEAQVEVTDGDKEPPIKAHIDFVVSGKSELLVVECKTTNTPIETPYESWIYQIQLQMGLLKRTTDKKVRGIIAAINLNTGWFAAFDQEFNDLLFSVAMERANILKSAMRSGETPRGEVGLLCSFCPFKDDCQAIRNGANELPPEMAEKVRKLKAYKAQKKVMDAIEAEIADFMRAANTRAVTSGELTVRLESRKGRETIDSHKLKELDPYLHEQCLKEGDPYSFLTVT